MFFSDWKLDEHDDGEDEDEGNASGIKDFEGVDFGEGPHISHYETDDGKADSDEK